MSSRVGGVDVGSVGLGCAAFGNLYEAVDDEASAAVVDAAWRRGIRLFDTAPLYGHGLSEARLGSALQTRPRDEYVVATKVGRLLVADGPAAPEPTIFADIPPVHPVFDFSADGVRRSVDESLARLGLDRVDLLHVHDPDDHLDEAVAAAYPALVRLRDEGVVSAVGLGTNTVSVAEHVLERVDLDWILLAGRYTLLDRSAADGLLDHCAERGVAVLAAGVFNSGVLADPHAGAHFHYAPAPVEVLERVGRLAEVCDAHGVPLPAAALQFPARHPAVTAVLVGPRSVAELEEDLDLLALDLPDDLWPALVTIP